MFLLFIAMSRTPDAALVASPADALNSAQTTISILELPPVHDQQACAQFASQTAQTVHEMRVCVWYTLACVVLAFDIFLQYALACACVCVCARVYSCPRVVFSYLFSFAVCSFYDMELLFYRQAVALAVSSSDSAKARELQEAAAALGALAIKHLNAADAHAQPRASAAGIGVDRSGEYTYTHMHMLAHFARTHFFFHSIT